VRRAALGTLAAMAALAAAAPAWSDLYTWVDASGRVQYSDQPPKDFKGEVKKVEVGDSAVIPMAVPKPSKDERAPSGKSAVAEKRRADRDRLKHDLDTARAKLGEARKALAEGQDPKVEEQQIVLRPATRAGAVPSAGSVSASTRANCRIVDHEGKQTAMCPVSMPNEGYFDRVAGLEKAVKAAEEEVATAERAYRRGVD